MASRLRNFLKRNTSDSSGVIHSQELSLPTNYSNWTIPQHEIADIRQNSFRLTDQNSKWYESTELSNPQGRVLNTKVFALIYSSQVQ